MMFVKNGTRHPIQRLTSNACSGERFNEFLQEIWSQLEGGESSTPALWENWRELPSMYILIFALCFSPVGACGLRWLSVIGACYFASRGHESSRLMFCKSITAKSTAFLIYGLLSRTFTNSIFTSR